MPSLPDRDWDSIYESRPSSSGSYLVDEFYVPALERSVRYDRVAGYFSSSALAVASRGIDALVDNDGEMRLVVGTELYETDRPVLEALTDELDGSLEELDDERLDAQLQLLAHYLREDRLHIKVAVPREGNWRIFHPKVGIFHDESGDALSFEGSINETVGGWRENYERFKVHRSWIDEQRPYVDADVDTFEQLWADDHPYVEVYDLPEAIERELVEWKAPDSEAEVDDVIQIAHGNAPPTERDKASIVADAGLAPGGLALAEEGCTIEPWPHQRVVSDTLVNTYPNSFLLCDEVGLGKTIEAGLTLSRLGLTGELETGLLLVPASLTVQWQEELWEKFNLNAYRFDRTTTGDYAFFDAFGREHPPPSVDELDLDDDDRREEAWVESPIWRFLHAQEAGDVTPDSAEASSTDGPPNPTDNISPPTVVIMSWHTARMTGRWNQVAPEEGGTVRTRQDVPASCRGRPTDGREGVWDAVVVDEAHNARGTSNFYQLLERLRNHTQTYYLLTATPMQLHAGELYDLMTLLDLPGGWDDQQSFEDFFQTRQALTTSLASVLGGGDGSGDSAGSAGSGSTADSGDSDEESWSAQSTLGEGRYQGRLPTDRSLSDHVFDAVAAELEVDDEDQARAIAKNRVLRACDLATDYGERYDGYVETVDDAIADRDVDHLDAREDEKLHALLYPDWKAEEEWMTRSRNQRLNALDALTAAGWRVVHDVLAASTPVDALVHRNTRDTLRKYEQVDLLDATVPERDPKQRQIDLTDETRAVYDRIRDYTRTFYKLAQQSSEAESRAIGFVMTTYRQRLTSSVYAISQSLQNRLETLREQRVVLEGKRRASEREYGDSQQVILETLDEYDVDDIDALDELEGDLEDADLSEVIPNVTDEGLALLEQEIEELESFVSDLARVDDDPKIDQLRADLDELERAGHNRIIVFTQYTDTMDFIRDRLVSSHGETVATYSGRGGEMYDADSGTWTGVGKERVKREFAADDSKVDILVCTDSASEGLNLQECGALINYDLPWNPMRVEQRIGRIDRIGQEHAEVTILNYSYKDTVETDIYDALDDRIGLFETVVGEMQPILSGVNEQIRSATLEADADDSREAVERADREISERVEEQERSDRVEVGESLESVDALVEQQVVEEAKLDAWRTYRHPDVADVGGDEYEHDAPFRTTGLERVLVDSEGLADAGVAFTSVEELDVDLDDGDFADAFEFGERTYRLSVEGLGVEVPDVEDEGTLAEVIAPGEDAVAVTFSAACAEEFPSVHHLAPGNPLLGVLVGSILGDSEEPRRLEWFGEYLHGESERAVVSGWGRDGVVKALGDTGEVEDVGAVGLLSEWFERFVENRDWEK